MLTKEMFDSMVKDAQNYWGANHHSRIVESVAHKIFFPRNGTKEELDRDYTVRGFSQCIDWEEPPGHVGPTYKMIKNFEGAKLVKYWWHEFPTVLIDMDPSIEGVYQLYSWMLEQGYKVNKF